MKFCGAGVGAGADAVTAAFERLSSVTQSVVSRSQEDPSLPGAVATDYLDLVGHTVYAWLWGRMANQSGHELAETKQATARFFFDRLLPRTLALEAGILATSEGVSGFPEASF